MNWFLRGVAAGVRTERFPDDRAVSDAQSPGLPKPTAFATEADAEATAAVCPTSAIETHGSRYADVAVERCVHCMRCARIEPPQEWRHDVLWAHAKHKDVALGKPFAHSIHVRIVDAGDCGSCLNELAQMEGPSYNLQRFGIFVTPTPRQADVLLVVGPVTSQMRDPLKTAYDAMPEPKRVVAVGTCAASGGLFGPSDTCAGGVADVVPVDVVVSGCPPPPWAIVAALRSVCGYGASDETGSSA